MKISTLNLFQFCNPDFSYYNKKEKYTLSKWEIKIKWIKEKIKEKNSDIIAFQEVFNYEDLEKICKELGYKYFKIVDKANIEKNIFKSCIVALASKHPIKKTFNINTTENFHFARKPIKVVINIDNKDILLYVIHLKSNRLNEFEHKFTINNNFRYKYKKIKPQLKDENSAIYQRVKEVKSLRNDIKKSIKEYSNIIVAGDFNDKLHSLCIDILKSSNLIDAFDLSNDIKRKYTSYYKSEGNIIDYILVSKNLSKILKYEVDDIHLKDNHNGSLLNSDHAIVTCSIDLK